MIVGGIDCETTGLEAGKDFVTEFAVVIFDGNTWEHKMHQSVMIHEPRALPLKPEIVALTGITDEMVKQGIPPKEAFEQLMKLTEVCDVLVAHNKAFDEGMLLAHMKLCGFEPTEKYKKTPWICSKEDIESNAGKRCTKLSHLCLDYGIAVDPSKLHRAHGDVILMGMLLQKIGLSAKQILDYSTEPWVYLEALCSKPWTDDGKSTAEAKKFGFAWERPNGVYSIVFPKKWVKRVKKSKLEAEIANQPQTFKRVTLEAPAS